MAFFFIFFFEIVVADGDEVGRDFVGRNEYNSYVSKFSRIGCKKATNRANVNDRASEGTTVFGNGVERALQYATLLGNFRLY